MEREKIKKLAAYLIDEIANAQVPPEGLRNLDHYFAYLNDTFDRLTDRRAYPTTVKALEKEFRKMLKQYGGPGEELIPTVIMIWLKHQLDNPRSRELLGY